MCQCKIVMKEEIICIFCSGMHPNGEMVFTWMWRWMFPRNLEDYYVFWISALLKFMEVIPLIQRRRFCIKLLICKPLVIWLWFSHKNKNMRSDWKSICLFQTCQPMDVDRRHHLKRARIQWHFAGMVFQLPGISPSFQHFLCQK